MFINYINSVIIDAYFLAEAVRVSVRFAIGLKALRGLRPGERPRHIRMLMRRG